MCSFSILATQVLASFITLAHSVLDEVPSHVMLLTGGQGPEFGVSVNPILTKGADYTHRITPCPPGFENLTASLISENVHLLVFAASFIHRAA